MIVVYIQFALVLLGLALGLLATKAAHRAISRKIDKAPEGLKLRYNRKYEFYYRPVLYPLITSLILLVLSGISSKFTPNATLIVGVLALMVGWIILSIVYRESKSRQITLISGVALGILFLLSLFDLIDPIVTYLDKFAINLGTFKISVYTICKSIIVVSLFIWVTGFSAKKMRKAIRQSTLNMKQHTRDLALKMSEILLYFVSAMLCLNVLGVDLTAFAVLGGAIGVGLGFGLQKITANFISGIILLAEGSIEVDDVVQLDKDTTGKVVYLGARYTLLDMGDGKEMMIPNEDFITGRVTNWTFTNTKAQLDIKLDVAYDADLELLGEIMTQAAKSHAKVLDDPKPKFLLREFGDGFIRVILQVWIEDIKNGRRDVRSELMFEIWRECRRQQIPMPAHRREVYLYDQQDGKTPKVKK